MKITLIIISILTLSDINVAQYSILIKQGNSTYHHNIKLEDYCLDEYKGQIKNLR